MAGTPGRKMDVPGPVVAWLITVKEELRIARGRTVTWPEVLEHVMAQQQAADQVKAGGR